MNEEGKKLSLLTNLDDIIFNDFMIYEPIVYEFSSIISIIINDIEYDVYTQNVIFILHYHKLIIEAYNQEGNKKHYSLSYNSIQNIYIFLGD